MRRVLLTLLLAAIPVTSLAVSDRVLVFAAASLKNALDEVAATYASDHDIDIRVSYGGSSMLARQIEQGAPADLYVSANRAWMDRLEEMGAINVASRVDLLGNHLVLVARRDSDIRPQIAPNVDIARALGDGGYLVLANVDAVPAGIYARHALQALGAWPSLQGRIVQTEDVRAALALVARGEAPLGVVYASDALAEADVRVVDRFPEDSHEAIVYPAAMVESADKPQAAAFMRYLQSDAAAAVFRRWGFRVLGTD